MHNQIIYLLIIVVTFAINGCTFSDQGNYNSIEVFQTSRDGDKLAAKGKFKFSFNSELDYPTVQVLPGQQFQKILGFGGSFTESSAYVLSKISPEKRTEVINAYFSVKGAAYSLTRTHMNSCDFSLENYAYANVAGDKDLEYFSIQEDMDDLIPLIKEAMKTSKDGFKIISSPWTAPTWMKENNDWNGGALIREYYSTWALYFSKYLKAYKDEGIDIWGVTPENEPIGNSSQWESMIFTPAQMVDFIKNHLGPQLEKDGISTKILIYDQNCDELKHWAETILSDSDAKKYVWGTAIHWYSSTISWYPETLCEIHDRYPDISLMHTEGCIDTQKPVWKNDKWYWSEEATDWGYYWASEKDQHLHPKYKPAFRYIRDIIGGLNNWVVGWVDWNIILDDEGGPNHAENWCIAPIIAKPETDEVYYTPLYYIMSHFSKFIRPDAIRIGIKNGTKDLMITACMNPDYSIAIEVFNPTDEEVAYKLKLENRFMQIDIPGNALQTLLVR